MKWALKTACRDAQRRRELRERHDLVVGVADRQHEFEPMILPEDRPGQLAKSFSLVGGHVCILRESRFEIRITWYT